MTHLNLYDGTIEGLRHKTQPVFCVQYHPGGVAGPARRGLPVRRLFEPDRGDSGLGAGAERSESFSSPKSPASAPTAMPRRTDLKRVLIIGSGPIVIGQACEFDYSGSQACKALRAEGLEVILVNSNPATIMTDPELADRTYVEPLTPEVLAADHRARASRRAAADGRRPDRAEPGGRSARERHARRSTTSS